MAADHGNDPFHHVRDSAVFELPQFFDGLIGTHLLKLPSVNLMGYELQITKFMVLQVVAGLLTLLIFSDLARRIRSGKPARGIWANWWEAVAVYIRDNVVRPTIGDGHAHHHGDAHHDEHGHDHGHHGSHAKKIAVGHPADRYLPFIWTCFFYVLFCNLLGAIPWLGSPTGNVNVTGMLALMAFGATLFYGMGELGVSGFWKNLSPPLDAPQPMKFLLVIMMFLIEGLGLLIKHSVLAARLFGNIMGGHTVVAVMLAFIAAEGVVDNWLWYAVTPASVLGQVAFGLLELFVAFLQAYVFAFLATIFIAMGSHPH